MPQAFTEIFMGLIILAVVVWFIWQKYTKTDEASKQETVKVEEIGSKLLRLQKRNFLNRPQYK